MKILMAASEAVPYCKTGGLADVTGALSMELAADNCNVLLLLPFYRQITDRKNLKRLKHTLAIPSGGVLEPVELWEDTASAGARVVFVGSDRYFNRGGIYGENSGSSYEDNDRRFSFFSRAVLAAAKALKFQPAIVHCHDWQTGLVPAYLKHDASHDPFFKNTASAFTIHNMAYQGNFDRSALKAAGLPEYLFHPQHLEFYGQVSYLKAGLVCSDALNTVSPSYAREIQSDPLFGCGLEGVLQERARRFRGILNGIDTDYWNPKTDKNLPARFDRNSLKKRGANKTHLQKTVGLAVQGAAPLLVFIGRLDQQKGVDQLIEVLPVLLRDNAQFICLGQGHSHLLGGLKQLGNQYPSQIHLETSFSEPLAHKIYAGADLFLMPSRYEPCGLGQMIAMRYGAIPVVTPTGGLIDTVEDAHPPRSGTGFVAENLSSGAYLNAVLKAVSFWKDQRAWQSLQRRAMSQDHSWKQSRKEYRALYHDAIRWRCT